jgi:alpha-mannosidase
MRMTAANGTLYADHYGQAQRDGWAEHQDQGVQWFRYVLCPHPEGWREADMIRRAAAHNTEEVHIMETYHEGALPLRYEGLSDGLPGNITVSALKPAYDGNGAVLRVCETHGKAASAAVRIPWLRPGEIGLDLKAYEVKSYRIPADGGAAVETCDLTEDARAE